MPRRKLQCASTLFLLSANAFLAFPATSITSERGNYKAWFENVAEAITSGDRNRLIVTPEAAALTIAIIEAATLSSKEGRRVAL